jgi:hypothetical protein
VFVHKLRSQTLVVRSKMESSLAIIVSTAVESAAAYHASTVQLEKAKAEFRETNALLHEFQNSTNAKERRLVELAAKAVDRDLDEAERRFHSALETLKRRVEAEVDELDELRAKRPRYDTPIVAETVRIVEEDTKEDIETAPKEDVVDPSVPIVGEIVDEVVNEVVHAPVVNATILMNLPLPIPVRDADSVEIPLSIRDTLGDAAQEFLDFLDDTVPMGNEEVPPSLGTPEPEVFMEGLNDEVEDGRKLRSSSSKTPTGTAEEKMEWVRNHIEKRMVGPNEMEIIFTSAEALKVMKGMLTNCALITEQAKDLEDKGKGNCWTRYQTTNPIEIPAKVRVKVMDCHDPTKKCSMCKTLLGAKMSQARCGMDDTRYEQKMCALHLYHPECCGSMRVRTVDHLWVYPEPPCPGSSSKVSRSNRNENFLCRCLTTKMLEAEAKRAVKRAAKKSKKVT